MFDLSITKFKEPGFAQSLSRWVSLPSIMSKLDDALDLIEMMAGGFKELGKRDRSEAMLSASRLSHDGLRALAHLGISRGLFEEAKESQRSRRAKR
jgi:hypothetical protein